MPELVSCYREHQYALVVYLAAILNRIEEKDEAVFRYEIESCIKLGLTNRAKTRYSCFLNHFTADTPSGLPLSFVEYLDNKSFRIK